MKKLKKHIEKLNTTVHPYISKAVLIFLVFIGLGAILTLLSFVQEPQDPQSQASGKLERFVKDEKKGLIWDDLREPISDDSTCKSRDKDKKKDLLEIVDKKTGKVQGCTHGPDPAPEGVDVRQSVEPVRTGEDDGTAKAAPGVAYAQTANSPAIPCEGDGQSGKRVQFIYAHASDRPNRYSLYSQSFQIWIANTDNVFAESAAQTGGVRHLRIVTDANCQALILNQTLSTTGDDTMANMQSELNAKGFNSIDRKYVVFMDANVYCGLGDIRSDTQSGSANINNSGPSFSRIDSGCWGLYRSAEAHELMHNLGGVQLSAPHSTGYWHCTDDFDRMCGDDGSGKIITRPCTDSADENRFDCNKDDFFYAGTPPAGSYLSNHWNTADSLFLTNTSNVVALPPHPSGCTPGPDYALIYSLANYQGNCKTLALGYVYRFANELSPVLSAASVKIGSNIKLTLCSSEQFAGTCNSYTQDVPTRVGTSYSALVDLRSGTPVPTIIPPSPTPTIPAPTPTIPTGDTTLPVVKISSPTNGAVIGNSVTVNSTATDNVGVTKMEIFIDNQLKRTSSTGAVSYNWNSKKASRGSHTITVKAYDARGNIGSTSIGVTK